MGQTIEKNGEWGQNIERIKEWDKIQKGITNGGNI